MRLEVDLSCDAESVGEARRALSELAPLIAPEQLRDVELLVSELVTNAVRHADLEPGEPIALHVRLDPDELHVEVHDGGPGFSPGPPPRDPVRPSGWGLYLVESLADAWGVDAGRLKRVWFTIRRAPEVAAA